VLGHDVLTTGKLDLLNEGAVLKSASFPVGITCPHFSTTPLFAVRCRIVFIQPTASIFIYLRKNFVQIRVVFEAKKDKLVGPDFLFNFVAKPCLCDNFTVESCKE
jgi:hypothetical protein